MRNKFKRGETVIVNGIGKNENKKYTNIKGNIIEKDVFFLDYNVAFSMKDNDWFDEKALKKIKKGKN